MTGSPTENTRAAIRVTQQSGQVQTPSVSRNGKEVVHLSDNGGHANLWIAKTDGSGIPRQIYAAVAEITGDIVALDGLI